MSVPLPVSDGPAEEAVKMRPPQSALLLSVMLCELSNALSIGEGTRFGLQFAALFQSPPATFVHVIFTGMK